MTTSACPCRSLPLKIDFSLVVFVLETIGESIDIAPNSKLIVMSLSDDSFRPTGSLKKNLYVQANFVRPIKFNIVP